MTLLAVSDLSYDPVAHQTTAPDGRLVPHVTEVLGAVGVATDFEELASHGPRMAATMEMARARGTAVHADCHAYDDDDLDWATADPRVAEYVYAWANCRAALELVPLAHARERQVFDPFNWFTGILDGIFVDGRGKVILADLKTGNPDDAAAHLQTAAYEIAACCSLPEIKVDERWAIQLMPGRRVPWHKTNYTDRPEGYMDGAKWLACLCAFNEQPGRRKAIR